MERVWSQAGATNDLIVFKIIRVVGSAEAQRRVTDS
jgi:hypothetical protein